MLLSIRAHFHIPLILQSRTILLLLLLLLVLLLVVMVLLVALLLFSHQLIATVESVVTKQAPKLWSGSM